MNKTAQTILLAFGIAGILYWLQADIRFDWADEGYLWYGAVHTRLGQVPLRDFQSYDPGRYYWCAAFSPLFGTGILAIRLAASLFQGLCLSFGLLAARRAVKRTGALFFIGFLSAAWMLWNFRYFDAGPSLIAVFSAVRLVERPTPRRHFQAGLVGGLTVFFGLNHGLYVLSAFFLLILFCDWKGMIEQPFKAAGFFVLGILAGLLPLVGMSLFIPGFFENYRDLLHFYSDRLINDRLLNNGAASFKHRLLWAWKNRLWAQGAVFLTVLLFYLLSLPLVLRMKKERILKNPLFIASFFVGVSYFHQIFSRANITHLGEGIFPVITAIFSMGAIFSHSKKKWIGYFLIAWIFVLTLTAAVPLSNLFYKLTTPKSAWVSYSFGKDKIWIPRSDAEILNRIKKIVNQHVPSNETLLIASTLTTLYCIFEKESPVWEIYFYLPQPDEVQEKMIRQLEEKKVNWAMVGDLILDGREEMRFPHTHTLLWNYLMSHFEALHVSGLPAGYYFMERTKPTR